MASLQPLHILAVASLRCGSVLLGGAAAWQEQLQGNTGPFECVQAVKQPRGCCQQHQKRHTATPRLPCHTGRGARTAWSL